MADDHQLECDCCGYEAERLEQYPADLPYNASGYAKSYHNLCDLCAGTMAGRWVEYPRGHDPAAFAILQAISYVGNAILDEIRNGRPSSGPSSPGVPSVRPADGEIGGDDARPCDRVEGFTCPGG